MPHNPLAQACYLIDPRDAEGRSRRRHVRSGVIAFSLTYLLLFFAQGAQATSFDGILGVMQSQTTTWLASLAATGRTAFLALATIEIAWCAALWAFEKDNMTSMMGDMVKSIMTISFFYALMINAPEWIPKIHEQFTDLSQNTIHAPALTVDAVIGQGLQACIFVLINLLNPLNIFAGVAAQIAALVQAIVGMVASIGISTVVTGGENLITPLVQIGMILLWGFTSWCIAGLVSLVVLVCYLIIALQLLMLQIEMGLLMAAGAVFLGLGGSRWTRDYVQKYLNHALVTGFRYLVLMMVLSVTMAGAEAAPWEATASAFTGLAQGMSGAQGDANQALLVSISSFGILFLVLIKTFLAIKAPDLAGALFSGGSVLTASSVSDTVMGVVGAAATVVGMPGAAMQSAEALKGLSAAAKPAGGAGAAAGAAKPSGAVAGL
ncbi:MAG TPA: type IV secretion system protein [Ramlibacter sp.]|uniref:type IV secretion system protein n=1 Tax=Ramlibacter sp. TaxID=1917967 RepID=UPI002C6E526B|nr:type IV secretion system protein [Ramlibacter sp.]HVZ42786.1 type IV secretion system protein [Ramlibacter sp.]